MNNQIFNLSAEERASLGKEWGWLFITGAFLFILGVFSVTTPMAGTLGVTYGFAMMLLINGAIHLTNAIKFRHHRGNVSRFLRAIIPIVTGALIVRYPGGGMLGVAFALSFYFFIQAAYLWLFSYAFKAESGWGLGMVNSALSFLLGVLIILTFPFSALWVPGLLLGIDFIFGGCMLMGLALSSRKLSKVFRPA